MRMPIHVDETRCIGAGNCALLAPDLFDQRDHDGVAIVLDPDPPADMTELLDQVIQRCPSGAITAQPQSEAGRAE